MTSMLLSRSWLRCWRWDLSVPTLGSSRLRPRRGAAFRRWDWNYGRHVAEIAGRCVTAVKAPDGVAVADLLAHIRSKYGVMMADGVGDLAGQAVPNRAHGTSGPPDAI